MCLTHQFDKGELPAKRVAATKLVARHGRDVRPWTMRAIQKVRITSRKSAALSLPSRWLGNVPLRHRLAGG